MSKWRLFLFLLPRMLKMMNRWPIRTLVWCGLGVAALVVTAGAALASWLVGVVAGWVEGGELKAAGQAAARAPVPEWLSVWIDPAWIQGLQALTDQLLHLSGDVMPLLAGGIGLLQWVVWGLWALVMALMALAGLKVHWLVGESQRVR